MSQKTLEVRVQEFHEKYDSLIDKLIDILPKDFAVKVPNSDRKETMVLATELAKLKSAIAEDVKAFEFEYHRDVGCRMTHIIEEKAFSCPSEFIHFVHHNFLSALRGKVEAITESAVTYDKLSAEQRNEVDAFVILKNLLSNWNNRGYLQVLYNDLHNAEKNKEAIITAGELSVSAVEAKSRFSSLVNGSRQAQGFGVGI